MFLKLKKYYKIRIIKGYKILKKKNQLNLIDKLKDQITNTPLKVNNNYSYNYNYELSLRQFLLRYLINHRLNISIMLAYSKNEIIIYPLPKEWINILEKNNFKVSKLLCIFLFNIFSIFFFFKSFKTYLYTLFQSKNISNKKDYIFIFGLSEKNIPQISKNSFDFFSWFLKFYNPEAKNFYVDFYHKKKNIGDINIYSFKEIFPKLNFDKKIYLTFYFVYFIIYNVINIIFFQYKKIYFSNEILKFKIISLISKAKLAKEYWFSISDFVYQPIWTHAINKSSKIILYNYASSFPGHKMNGSYPPNEVGLSTMTWPHIVQWEGNYSEFIKKTLKEKNVEIINKPPIWLSDKQINININKKKSISVFDVAPQNYFRYCYTNSSFYRTFKVSKLFFEDICKVADYFGYDVIIKNKRVDGRYHNKLYIEYLKKLNKRKNVFITDCDVSPLKLINSTSKSISMPFTSTSIIANYYKKKTCFYDPIKILDINDRAAQNVKLVLGYDNLKNWILKNK